MAMPRYLDEMAELLLAASNLAPLLKKIVPTIKKFLSVEILGGGGKSPTETAKEEDALFESTLDDENYFELVRGNLLAKHEQEDKHLSTLIQDLNKVERTVLRKLIFAGKKAGGPEGQTVILLSLAKRGPELTDMRARFEEMGLELRATQADPVAAAGKLLEHLKNIGPKFKELKQFVEPFAEEYLEAVQAGLAKPVPASQLLFLNRLKLSLPKTVGGKIAGAITMIVFIIFLICLFTPQR